MYYDLSISYPYLSLITLLSFYSISFYAYSYPFSPMPIHIHSLLCLFISSVLIPLFVIALNFSFPFIFISTHPILSLLLCYSISILQSIFLSFIPYSPLHPPSLLYSLLIHPLIPILSTFSSLLHHLPITLPIHSFPYHPLPFYSHSILHPIPFQRHCPFLFFLSLLQTTLGFDSLLLLSSLFPDSFLLSFSSYIYIPFFLIYSRNIYSIDSLLSYPFTHILLSSRLLYSAEELHSNKSKGQLLV